jgi:hypothetical protein
MNGENKINNNIDKIINFINPDKIDMICPPPGLDGPYFRTWKDWFRFICFSIIFILPIIIISMVMLYRDL